MPGQLANNFGLGPSVHRDRRVTGRCQQQIFIKNEHGDVKVVKQIDRMIFTHRILHLTVLAFITTRKASLDIKRRSRRLQGLRPEAPYSLLQKLDRKTVGWGKRVSVRVELGGRR